MPASQRETREWAVPMSKANTKLRIELNVTRPSWMIKLKPNTNGIIQDTYKTATATKTLHALAIEY